MKLLNLATYKESQLAKQRAREHEIEKYDLRPFRNISPPVMREMLRAITSNPTHAKTLVGLTLDRLTDEEVESLIEHISSVTERYKKETGQL